MPSKSHSLVLLVPAGFLLLAALVAPHVTVGDRFAANTVFAGATAFAMLGVGLGARIDLSRRAVLVVDAIAVALLAGLACGAPGGLSPLFASLALVSFASATGAFLGSRIQDPGHLLPAGVVAAALDVASVVSASGPSHAIARSERALSVLAVSFPVPGTRAFAPALGVGDLVFVALMLGAARVHALPYARMALLATTGVLLSGLASALAERPVPALPAIVVVVLAFVPRARTLERRDRTVAAVAVSIAVGIAVLALLGRLKR